jgi:hypothetical protein
MEEVFKRIYEDRIWGSISEKAPYKRKPFIEDLTKLINDYSIQSILDIPCGYFRWMKDVTDLVNLPYTGADIVETIVNKNKEFFGDSFLHLDIVKDKLPEADLLICRDCLVHFPYEDISKALRNIRKQPIKYLLTTTFTDRITAHDIKLGEWRPINLEKEPFNLPSPISIINEQCMEGDGAFQDKSLALWSIEQLKETIIA